jgi:hypothetical protein
MIRERLERTDAELSIEQLLSLAFVLELPIKAGGAGEDAAAGGEG